MTPEQDNTNNQYIITYRLLDGDIVEAGRTAIPLAKSDNIRIARGPSIDEILQRPRRFIRLKQFLRLG